MRHILGLGLALGLAVGVQAAKVPTHATSHANGNGQVAVTETLITNRAYPVDNPTYPYGRVAIDMLPVRTGIYAGVELWVSAPNEPTQMYQIPNDLIHHHQKVYHLPAGTYRVAASRPNALPNYWDFGPLDITLKKTGKFTWHLLP